MQYPLLFFGDKRVSSDLLLPTAKKSEIEMVVSKSQTEMWNPLANSPA